MIHKPPTGFVDGVELVSWPYVVDSLWRELEKEIPISMRAKIRLFQRSYGKDGRRFWETTENQRREKLKRSHPTFDHITKLEAVLVDTMKFSAWIGYLDRTPIPTFRRLEDLYVFGTVWNHFGDEDFWDRIPKDDYFVARKKIDYWNDVEESAFWSVPDVHYGSHSVDAGFSTSTIDCCAVFLHWPEVSSLIDRIPKIKGTNRPNVSAKVLKRFKKSLPIVMSHSDCKAGEIIQELARSDVAIFPQDVSALRWAIDTVDTETRNLPNITDEELMRRVSRGKYGLKNPVLQILVSDIRDALIRKPENAPGPPSNKP